MADKRDESLRDLFDRVHRGLRMIFGLSLFIGAIAFYAIALAVFW